MYTNYKNKLVESKRTLSNKGAPNGRTHSLRGDSNLDQYYFLFCKAKKVFQHRPKESLQQFSKKNYSVVK